MEAKVLPDCNVGEAHGSGWIPKRPKGPDCKSGGNAFAGSNPAPPMSIPMGMELDSVTGQGQEPDSQNIKL